MLSSPEGRGGEGKKLGHVFEGGRFAGFRGGGRGRRWEGAGPVVKSYKMIRWVIPRPFPDGCKLQSWNARDNCHDGSRNDNFHPCRHTPPQGREGREEGGREGGEVETVIALLHLSRHRRCCHAPLASSAAIKRICNVTNVFVLSRFRFSPSLSLSFSFSFFNPPADARFGQRCTSSIHASEKKSLDGCKRSQDFEKERKIFFDYRTIFESSITY